MGFDIIMLMANNKTPKKKTNKAKASTSIVKQNNIWAFVRTHKLLLIVLFILFAIATWYIIVQIITINERKTLNNAEKSLDAFTGQLQEVVGSDVLFDKNKSCSYKSTKFVSKGNPSCGISYQAKVPVNSAELATNYAVSILDKLKDLYIIQGKFDGKFIDGINSNSKESSSYGYGFELDGLECGLSIGYFDPKYTFNNYLENHEIAVDYYCTDLNSHKEFYSVNN
jgi:hypothetical protein